VKNFVIALVRHTATLLVRVAFIVIGLPVLYLIEPFRKVRLGILYTQRIGHLAGNCDLFLRQRQLASDDDKTVYAFFGWDPANRQMLTMLKRHMPIIEHRMLTRVLFYIRPILSRTRFFQSLSWSNHDYEFFSKGRATLTFTDAEEEEGRRCLREMGIGAEDWFVCFHARDSAYLNAWRPEHRELWRTRDFRNSNIVNYLAAADFVTSMGGFAIRMGSVVASPLPDTGNPKIIDYATRHRSDFMDIFLCAKCRFFIGTNSGLFVVATAFDVPVALVNLQPLGLNAFRNGDLFIPKLLRDEKSEHILTFGEAFRRGFYDLDNMFETALHQSQDCEWVENDPDDICDLAEEMIAKLEGLDPDPEGVTLSDAYRDAFMAHVPGHQYAGRLGARFARRHRDLIEAEA
jgi:putative glycosyltransferase (TIGR04372 family)